MMLFSQSNMDFIPRTDSIETSPVQMSELSSAPTFQPNAESEVMNHLYLCVYVLLSIQRLSLSARGRREGMTVCFEN